MDLIYVSEITVCSIFWDRFQKEKILSLEFPVLVTKIDFWRTSPCVRFAVINVARFFIAALLFFVEDEFLDATAIIRRVENISVAA